MAPATLGHPSYCGRQAFAGCDTSLFDKYSYWCDLVYEASGSGEHKMPETRTRSRTTASCLGSPTSKSRPQTNATCRPKSISTSTGYGCADNDLVCAISESRGISPSVGLAFVNLTTCEAVLCQFVDTQTFARTCHKIKVFDPSEIVYATTVADSKLVSIITENLNVQENGIDMNAIDRRYWSESAGLNYVERLALPSDLEALKLSLTGNFFAICCFSAVRAMCACKDLLTHTGAKTSRPGARSDFCSTHLACQVRVFRGCYDD